MIDKKTILITCAILGFFSPRLKAQYDPSFVNYWAMQAFYNPATTGIDSKLNFQGAYSMQLTGFENAPQVMLAHIDMPLFFIGDRHGVGLGFMNDQIGLFKHQKFYLQYAYHQPLWGGRLSAGVHLAMLSETFDGSALDLGETGDPAFPTAEATGAGFDMGLGINFKHKQWFAGLSMTHLTSPTVSLGDEKINEINISPAYYFMGGYNINLKNSLYKVHTFTMLRSDFSGFRSDLTGILAYEKDTHQLYGGLSYSPTISVSLLFGGNFHGVNLGYAYEVFTSAIGAVHGNHEIIIGYKTDLNMFKRGKNKHKSVRLL